MKCRVCGDEVDECDGIYLVGGDLCFFCYWEENKESPYYPLSGHEKER